MSSETPTRKNGGAGGALREDGSAAALRPKSGGSRDLRWDRVDGRLRGEGGAFTRLREKKWGKEKGGARRVAAWPFYTGTRRWGMVDEEAAHGR
jgi:hypothetical protein